MRGKVIIICRQCHNSKEVYHSWSKRIFCSRICTDLARRGKPGGRLGKKASQETIEKLRISHLGQLSWNKGLKGYLAGDKHYKWQKKNPSYRAVHVWINKILGTPRKCDFCNCINSKRYEWANISKEYKREINDWIRLCKSCHNIYDNTGFKSWEKRRVVLGL